MHVISAFLNNFLPLYYRCNINHRLLRFDDMKNEEMTFAILNCFDYLYVLSFTVIFRYFKLANSRQNIKRNISAT